MESTQILEPVLFTTISEQMVYESKPSYTHKLMALIAIDYDLKMNVKSHYEKALEELIKRVKYN